jgi:hypothetical protein
LNPVYHLEHLISKVNWVNFKINSVLPSLLLVFVEKVLTCLFSPPSRQLSPIQGTIDQSNGSESFTRDQGSCVREELKNGSPECPVYARRRATEVQ